MGDRVVPPCIFQRLLETHTNDREAELTILTAIYEPPNNEGKGRILRDPSGSIVRIVEQRDIEHLDSPELQQQLFAQAEGNCPLYVIRASRLRQYLGEVTDDNAQNQFYLTDIVAGDPS